MIATDLRSADGHRIPCDEQTIPVPSTEACTRTGHNFVEIVGPTIVELHAAGAGGTVVASTGAGVAVTGVGVTGEVVTGAGVVTGGVVPTIVVVSPAVAPVLVPMGGAAPKSIPVLGRSRAANKIPLAPTNVSAGNTRRENVSLFIIYHQTCSE